MQPQQTPSSIIKILTMLHASMLLMQILFSGVVVYLFQSKQLVANGEGFESFPMVAAVLSAAGVTASMLVPTQLLKGARAKSTLIEKLRAYLSVMLVKYAFMEVPSLFSIVCYLLTGSYLFLGIAFLMITIFVLIRPTVSTAVTDLELSPADRALLES